MDINLKFPQASNLLVSLIALISLLLGFLIGFLAKKTLLFKQKELELQKIIDSERKAKESAQEAIKARDEFLSIATHELKTPLTTIILRLQSTLDSILNQSLANFSGERLVSSLTIAQEQTRRLQNLIKDLLNFSLITTGKIDLEFKKSDINDIVKSTLDRFDDHIKLAGCQLEFKTSGPIDGLWDQIRLEQAISNLLTNAIKYGEGEPIEVELQQENHTAKISVADNGIGIDPQLQKNIFDRFKRATKDKKYQGLGVGLFIVKQIAEAHQGRVTIKSHLGQGSKFTIPIQEISRNHLGENPTPLSTITTRANTFPLHNPFESSRT